MKNLYVFCLLLLMVFAPFGNIYCAETDGQEEVFAIQNRVFHRNHELAVTSGYIPNEDFYHNYPFGVGYTFNFNEHIGWEVLRAEWDFTTEKGLLQKLEEQFSAQPSEHTEPRYMFHSHLLFKPLYGKDAVLNRGIVNHETYFFAGGGLVNYEYRYPEGHPNYDIPTSENVPTFSFGVGMKYFINQKFCLNIEIRDMMNFWTDNTENRIYFGIGLGYRFNLKPRQTEKDHTVEKLRKYLIKSETNGN